MLLVASGRTILPASPVVAGQELLHLQATLTYPSPGGFRRVALEKRRDHRLQNLLTASVTQVHIVTRAFGTIHGVLASRFTLVILGALKPLGRGVVRGGKPAVAGAQLGADLLPQPQLDPQAVSTGLPRSASPEPRLGRGDIFQGWSMCRCAVAP